jgi:hypothetical protein
MFFFKNTFRFDSFITNIQSVPEGKVNILGGHGIGHSKQKGVYVRVLFRMASERELLHCTSQKLLIRKRYCILFLIPVLIVQVTKLVQIT